MNQRLISEIGKSQRLHIVNLLKRSQGLSVNEIADRLKMSYMGIKQHCVELESGGYLDKRRRPRTSGTGRPEQAYRLTQRAHELFPETSNAATIALLHAAEKLYGPTAPDKLLMIWFQEKAALYEAKVKGDTLLARAKSLAKLRDDEGCMAELEDEEGLRIVEFHSPIGDLLEAFPLVARLETELFERVLRAEVVREEETASGLYHCAFVIQSGGY
jgi:predicted ArsR family transcriptional regulator